MKKCFAIAALSFFAFGHSIGLTRAQDTAPCPSPVKEAIRNTHAGSIVTSCKEENENGKIQYEVKLKTAQGRSLEMDIAPDGSVLLTEEEIAVAVVPPAVSQAFATRYPDARPTRAEKQTMPDNTVTYEISFKAKGKKSESTFDEKGSFVGEE